MKKVTREFLEEKSACSDGLQWWCDINSLLNTYQAESESEIQYASTLDKTQLTNKIEANHNAVLDEIVAEVKDMYLPTINHPENEIQFEMIASLEHIIKNKKVK